MKSILITGASGFVGSHFIRRYSDQYKILAIWRNNVISGQNVMSLQLDLSDKNALLNTLKKTKPEVILHLAGMGKTWGNPLDVMIHDNLVLTHNLLDSVMQLQASEEYNPKIIIVSSAEVYGKTVNPKSIEENAPFFPLNEYGLSKMYADRLAFFFSQRYKLDIVILRSFNHIGPGQKLGFFVSDMASQIVQIERGSKNTITVGNLESVRDILDVRDVIRAYQMAIERNATTGEAFNICSGKGISMKQLLDKLIALSNKSISIERDPSRMRAGDNPISVGSNKKFKSLYKWKPEITLDETLRDCLEYWRNNS